MRKRQVCSHRMRPDHDVSHKMYALPYLLTIRKYSCAALPNVNSPGTSIACTTPADRDARIAATGATAGSASAAGASSVAASSSAVSSVFSSASSTVLSSAATASSTASSGNDAAGGAAAGNGGDNAQTSLTLDPAVIATGFENDGQQEYVL